MSPVLVSPPFVDLLIEVSVPSLAPVHALLEPLAHEAPTLLATQGSGSGFDHWFTQLDEAVRNASGIIGLFVIAIYSFLIAFVLPLPSEVVLIPHLGLGLPRFLEIGLIMVVSGLGKAAGSVFAFSIGHNVSHSGPVINFLKRSRIDIVEWSENKTLQLAQDYGYAGLALALSVPFFPDTLSIYAFSVLEDDMLKFGAATFAGSVGRLLVTVLLVGGGLAISDGATGLF